MDKSLLTKIKEFFTVMEEHIHDEETEITKETTPIEQTSSPSFDKEKFDEQLQLLLENKDQHLDLISETLKKLSHKPKETRVSHRFDGKQTIPSQQGLASLGMDLEETAIFADEVEKLCQQGLDRRSAYIQAKQNLMEK